MKKMGNIKKIANIYLILMYLNWSIQIFNLEFFKSMQSINIIINFVGIILLGIGYWEKRLLSYKKEIIILIMTIGIVFLGFAIKGSGIGATISIITLMCMLVLLPNIGISKKVIKIISIMMLVTGIIYLFTSKLYYNPNGIAQFWYIIVIYSKLALDEICKKKNLNWIVYIVVGIAILQTNSRGVLLAYIVFCIITFVMPKKLFFNNKMYYLIILGITMGSIIFCYVYVKMWESGIDGAQVLGSEKNLFSGREGIWKEIFEAIYSNPILGVGSKYTLNSYGSLSIHNSMLNIAGVYGIPVLIMIVYMIFNCFKKLKYQVNAQSDKRKTIIGWLIGFFVLGFFETNLLWGQIMFQGMFVITFLNEVNEGEI